MNRTIILLMINLVAAIPMLSDASPSIDMKLCSHLDVPSNTTAYLGRAGPNESCSIKFRDKIKMLEHHATGLVETVNGQEFVIGFKSHIIIETQEHDPAVCIVEEERIVENGL